MQAEIQYREVLADHSLRRFVMCYWEFRTRPTLDESFLHHIPPDGCASLANAGAGILSIVGPRLDALRVEAYPGMIVRGIRFWPGATGAILGITGLALRDKFDRAADAITLLSPELAHLENFAPSFEAFVDAAHKALEVTVAAAGQLDEIVSQSVAEIMAKKGSVTIGALARSHGLSERQFQRRFRNEVGITPKQFARIRRFRSSVAELIDRGNKGWASIAYDHGFADQAHLCREYAQLVGMNPEDLKRRIGDIDLIDVKP